MMVEMHLVSVYHTYVPPRIHCNQSGNEYILLQFLCTKAATAFSVS